MSEAEETGTELAVDNDPKKREPMMPGQSTDLAEQYSQVAMTPDQFMQTRKVLIKFVAENLVEATYDKSGYPVEINDYYVVPGAGKKKALSRKGADSLSDLYKYKALHMDQVSATVEKDYVSITYKCTLHRSNTIVAERDATASTAEKSMQRSEKKYTLSGKKTADWRGAENDIRAKAQKRAFVQAVIHACNASDILAAADDPSSYQDANEVEDVAFEVVGTAETLWQRMKTVLDLCLTADIITAAQAEKFVKWANKPGREESKIEEEVQLLDDKLTAAAESDGPF